MECKETRQNLICNVVVNGGCENYNGEGVKIDFTLDTKLPCTHPHTTLQKTVEIKENNQISANFGDYLAGVQYQVKAVIVNDVGTGDRFNITFNTGQKGEYSISDMSYFSSE